MVENIPFNERAWTGLDVSTPPDLLDKGRVTVADNTIWARGQLQTRPGLRAQLAAALDDPTGAAFGFEVDTDGEVTFYILFVAGTALRIWQQGNNATTAVSGDVAFDRTRTQFVRLGDYVFISGADNGNLYRYAVLTGTFESAMGLAKPTGSVTAALTSRPLSGFTTSANWQFDTVDDVLTVPDNYFASGSPSLIAYWDRTGTADLHSGIDISPNDGVNYVRMDDQGSTILLHDALTVPDKDGGFSSRSRKCTTFVLEWKQKDDFDVETVIISMIGYDASDNEIARTATQEFKTNNPGDGAAAGRVQTMFAVFSFAGILTEDQLHGIRIYVEPGAGNIAGDNGPYITGFVVHPVCQRYRLDFTDWVAVHADDLRNDHSGAEFSQITHSNVAYVGNHRLSFQLAATTDFDTESRLTIPCNLVVPFDAFRVQLGLRKGNGGTDVAVYTEDLTLTEVDGQDYLSVDISGMEETDRQGIEYIDLYFPDDLQFPVGYTNTGQVLFQFKPIIRAGNLSVGLSYDWCYVEIQNAGTTDELTSPAGAIAGTLVPTVVQAEGSIAAATIPTNDLDPAAAIAWYRRGGTFGDGYFRLIGIASVSAPSSGEGWSTDVSGGTMTLIDDVPDSALYLAATLADHDPVPSGIEAVGVHASRLALMTTDRLYLSGITFGRSTGLYFHYADSPNAPDIRTRGLSTRVSGVDGLAGGRIQRLVSHLSRLVLIFQGSLYLFSGSDPLSFALARFAGETGIGAASPYSVAVFDNGLFLATNAGLRLFSGAALSADVGDEIREVIAPDENTTIFTAGNRLYLSNTEGEEQRLYVWDRQGQCWTRWMVDVSAGIAHGNDLYVLSGGQVKKVAQFGDTAVLGGDVSPVAVAVQGRTYTADDNELQALRLSVTAECADASPVYSLQVTADEDTTARTWTTNFTAAAGERSITDLGINPRVRGRGINWRFGANTLNPVTLKRIALVVAPGGRI